jgi:hypothetical protein
MATETMTAAIVTGNGDCDNNKGFGTMDDLTTQDYDNNPADDGVPSPMECIGCGKVGPPVSYWTPGWGCLHGCLAACSLACAEKYHREHCRQDIPMDVEFFA